MIGYRYRKFKMVDKQALLEIDNNFRVHIIYKQQHEFRKTLLTILLAAIIGLSGIWYIWTLGGCPRLSFDQTNENIHGFPTCSPLPPESARYNCWPQSENVTREECTSRKCCFVPMASGSEVPSCFYPPNYQLYTVQSLKQHDQGFYLTLLSQEQSGWPRDVTQLAVNITIETNYIIHFKIYSPNEKRYEVPIQLFNSRQSVNTSQTDFSIEVPSDGLFYISIIRKSTGQILFSTKNAAPLIFSDQYLQIGTKLSSEYIYGLGEHMDRYLLSTQWSRKVLWAFDTPPDPNYKDLNLYGVHPIYLNMGEDHKAHGVFLLNSNAMEVELQPEPSLTYRTVGGVLDFYIFSGPTPDNIVEQYTEVIGRPFMPPYWALGFHLSRFGYSNVQNLTKVVNRMRKAKMYYDTQWTDIDAMRSNLDWTYDSNGSWKGLDKLVKDLHDHGQHYNILIDPIITAEKPNGTYLPLSDGLAANVFVKADNGSFLVGKGWPGDVYYIDWWNPNASTYWTKQAETYHKIMPYDSLMISIFFVAFVEDNATMSLIGYLENQDMNEPSNAVNGSVDGCPDTHLENPPFLPRGLAGGKLQCRTLCPSAKQHISVHYNLHSLYGYSQSVVTKSTLDTLLGKRNIAISRSSYAGSGHFAGHWSGDVTSTWAQLNYTVTGMLSYQLFGIAFWGADVCGFGLVATPELCTRWTQLGAFYPFMFNHNEPGTSDQDPASFDEYHRDIMRKALELRYYLLPYLYTLFYRTHVDGTPVVRPLFFQYPDSENNAANMVTEQFMWGSALLVTPALNVNVTEGMGYLPKDRWYNFYTHLYVDSSGQFEMFHLPLDTINVKVRGGSILPMQTPEVTTTKSRNNKFILYVALAADSSAAGELYWDDGESLDSISGKNYNLIQFHAGKNVLMSEVVESGYKGEPMLLGTINVLGVEKSPAFVKLNGKQVENLSYRNKAIYVSDLNINLLEQFDLVWG